MLRRLDGGYSLQVDPASVDLHRARGLADRARMLGDADRDRDQQGVELLREACELWRGVPLAGLTPDWAARTRTALVQEWLALIVQRFTAELRVGEPAAVVGELAALLAEHPLVEPLAGLQMVALYRCGRHAEALDVYARTRKRLVDELGDEPGADLRRLHGQILRHDPVLDLAPAGAAAAVVPAQLPADVAGFTGRVDELDMLDELLLAAPERWTTPTAIFVVAGSAGIGKTALAVHWAHRVAGQFPEGQLYVNLRGFDSAHAPVSPAAAIRLVLDALQVPPQRIPADSDAQVGLYRSLLAPRRMLILLDNARDAEQVRPLLPGSAECRVVVTSRDRLASLVATEGAGTVTLDLFSTVEARQFLERRLGTQRVAAEPDATDSLIASCARLPLALAVAAARAAINPGFPLSALAQELRESHTRLSALSGSDAATDLRAVFSCSYATLTTDAARLFRLLGLHPGPDVKAAAAASLAGCPVSSATSSLAELARAHLVTEHTPSQYTLHDLLRAYATELADTTDSEPDRRGAWHRLLDHYLHTAHAAALLLNPQRHPITLRPPRAAVTAEVLDGQPDALAWFTAEHRALVAVSAHAARTRFDTHTWQLAWCLVDFLRRQGHWQDWADTQTAALAAGRRLADPVAQAVAGRALASAYRHLGRHDDAHACLHHALERFRELGDHTSEAHTHIDISVVLEQQGRYREALAHAQHALDLYRATDQLAAQANALNGIGWLHIRLGDPQRALRYCQQALTLAHETGDQPRQALTWDSLGYAHHHLGQYRQAITSYRHAIDLVRNQGDRYMEAEVLDRLGDTHHAASEPDAAHKAWHQALEILIELDHPNANQVRAKLRKPAAADADRHVS